MLSRIRLPQRPSSGAPLFCEQSAGFPAAHESSRLVPRRGPFRAAGNVDGGVGDQGVTTNGRATKRAEVDLGLRHRRPSDRVVDARSIPASEHRNNAEVSRQGSQETRSSRARGDGAGPSRLAHREAAQVAKTNNAALSSALFPRIESCGTALALVPRARLEQSRLSRRGSADPGSQEKPPFTPSGTSPLHLCHAMGNARESSVTRMR